VCPGNEQSAGKRKRSRTTKGNRWLRRALNQAALGRLAGRRGKLRAIVAVAHSLETVLYHLIKNPHLEYRELGGDYFDKLDPQRLCRHLVKRLNALGYEVTLNPREAA
jgi:hypothetical protein